MTEQFEYPMLAASSMRSMLTDCTWPKQNYLCFQTDLGCPCWLHALSWEQQHGDCQKPPRVLCWGLTQSNTYQKHIKSKPCSTTGLPRTSLRVMIAPPVPQGNIFMAFPQPEGKARIHVPLMEHSIRPPSCVFTTYHEIPGMLPYNHLYFWAQKPDIRFVSPHSSLAGFC